MVGAVTDVAAVAHTRRAVADADKPAPSLAAAGEAEAIRGADRDSADPPAPPEPTSAEFARAAGTDSPRRRPRRATEAAAARARPRRSTGRRWRSTSCARGPMPKRFPPWRSWRAGWCRASACRRTSRPAPAGCCAPPSTARPQSAFNVGVMYERGFVVERDSTRAVEWYRKAAEANLPMAKHNLALMLRDGQGRAARRQGGGRAAALGEPPGHDAPRCSPWATSTSAARPCRKDPAMALAWFAITAEFERQTNHGGDSTLAKAATQRARDAAAASCCRRELERAQQIGPERIQADRRGAAAAQAAAPLPSDLPPAALPRRSSAPLPGARSAASRRCEPTRRAGPKPPTSRSASSSRRWST